MTTSSHARFQNEPSSLATDMHPQGFEPLLAACLEGMERPSTMDSPGTGTLFQPVVAKFRGWMRKAAAHGPFPYSLA
jgi:hypothetical protein